jgi:hypothetical protein
MVCMQVVHLVVLLRQSGMLTFRRTEASCQEKGLQPQQASILVLSKRLLAQPGLFLVDAIQDSTTMTPHSNSQRVV